MVALALLSVPPPSAKPRSVSLGNASNGTLRHSTRLPVKGPHHRVIKKTRRLGQHYGTDELVRVLKTAAAAVAAKTPGSVLLVGNLSKKGGGDLRPSVSHNSGRDADIAFYAMDARGRPVHSLRGFKRFNARGRAGKLRFDTARNWTLVRSLLTNKTVQLQWLFMSNSLRERLLDHARAAGEPADVIEHASAIMGQPGNSSAHAEHIHVRLYCALHERLQGCRNYGTTHPWIDRYTDELLARTRELVADFAKPDTVAAVAAIRMVGAIRGHSAVDDLSKAIGDVRPEVRSAAARAVILLDGAEAAVPALVKAAQTSTDRAWTHQLVGALGKLAVKQGAAVLVEVLAAVKIRQPRTRKLAAEGLGRIVHIEGVPALISAVADKDRSVRQAAADALLMITNHNFGVGRRSASRWRRWWRRNKDRDRLQWVRAGFARHHRIRVTRRGRVSVLQSLLPLVRAGGAVGFNARALFEQLTGFTMTQGHFTDFQMFRFYRTWLKNHPKGRAQR